MWRWCQDCLHQPCGYWLPQAYTDEFPHRHARNKCIASQSTTFGKRIFRLKHRQKIKKKKETTLLTSPVWAPASTAQRLLYAYMQLLIWSIFSDCFLSWALWLKPEIPQTWAGLSVEISEKPEEVRCPYTNRKCCLTSHAPLETAAYSFSCFGDAVIFLKVASINFLVLKMNSTSRSLNNFMLPDSFSSIHWCWTNKGSSSWLIH